jgi:anaerobic selenocysteine-containing dehydrogenase
VRVAGGRLGRGANHEHGGREQVPGFCGLCIGPLRQHRHRGERRFTRLDPDPAHPTGQALCAKGRAAPELVYSKERLTQPLRRTRPKGEADPGWVEISWDEALDATGGGDAPAGGGAGAAMRGLQPVLPLHHRHCRFGALRAPADARLRHAEPRLGAGHVRLGPGLRHAYAFGVATVATGSGGGAMADIANSGCLVLWGYNPSYTRLTHATATVAALKRGMKLIVVDPRHVGLASKADLWLRPRPGTDGALALGLAHVMITRGWYDRGFVREWTNAPHLVRSDTGRLLRAADLAEGGEAGHFVAWDASAGRPVAYDPATGRYGAPAERLALEGEAVVATKQGTLPCRPVFAHYAALCARHTPELVADTCWVAPEQLEAAARLIWRARPVSYYAWSGHEHHANTTETARAMALLYALTGSFDRRGGNVLLPVVPNAAVTGRTCRLRGAWRRPSGRRPVRSGRRSGTTSPRTTSTARCWRANPTRFAGWWASAPTCCSRFPTRRGDGGRSPRWTSTCTPTCS